MANFSCKLLERREKSIQIEHNGKTVWIGRSQVHKLEIKEDPTYCTISIPDWLYEKEFEQ